MIAKIAVSAANFAIDRPYSYAIPTGMALQPGHRVIVPFGNANRASEGVVLEVSAGAGPGLKNVERLMDSAPLLDGEMLRLAAFLRERYFCTFYDAVRVMLPAELWFQTKESYSLTGDTSWEEKPPRQPEALAVLKLLKELGGQAEGTVLRACVASEDAFDKAVSYLRRKKWITAQTRYLPKTGDKLEKIVTLAVSREEAEAYAAARPRSASMQRAVLELLCGLGSVSAKELCYFTGAGTATLKRLESQGIVTLSDRRVLRCREIRPAPLSGPLMLNGEQQAAVDGLTGRMDLEKPGTALLYGITGSGKTAVYLKLIRHALDRGKTAMLLVPEIALTPQLLSLLAAFFGGQVAVLHSSLGVGERYDQWKRIRAGEARVVVGTRSAVFAPARDLGLIVVDEEQEHSYRSENSPRYDAREVAVWRGTRENALVLFGSATPSVETMYRARTGAYGLYSLTERYNGKPLPEVRIVDMREELKNGNELSISAPLQEALRETFRAEKQAVLFLNRRGNSRALVCVDCGKAPECPRCSARLTYHSANERLMCHYCGFSQPVPRACPSCSGPLKRIGTGTQKVQEELETLFPGLRVQRMDADTVSAVNTHEKLLEQFQKEKIPVLLGTQMVAKGLNLPDVTLVGVLDADLSLYSGGFRGAETTFNMLTQVVGRAGRGDTTGRAVIQTLVPEHKVITLAAAQDYEGFYELEVALRRVQSCPPFGDLAEVVFTGREEAKVLRGAVRLRDSLLQCLREPAYCGEQCGCLGPAPCPVPKINYHFRYRLTLRCHMTRNLRNLLAYLLRQFVRDRDNRGVSAFVDVNGYE